MKRDNRHLLFKTETITVSPLCSVPHLDECIIQTKSVLFTNVISIRDSRWQHEIILCVLETKERRGCRSTSAWKIYVQLCDSGIVADNPGLSFVGDTPSYIRDKLWCALHTNSWHETVGSKDNIMIPLFHHFVYTVQVFHIHSYFHCYKYIPQCSDLRLVFSAKQHWVNLICNFKKNLEILDLWRIFGGY